MSPVSVRRALASDWVEVERLCGLTGGQGEPVAEEERAAFVRHWIAPYKELRPQWTFVALEGERLVGYLTGCPDSLAFERERRRVYDPPPDSREFFPAAVRLKLWNEHPAHFQLGVAADARRRGVGAALVRAFYAELRKARVPSAHLFCGTSSLAFFERMAFRPEAVVEAAPGAVLRAMTRPVV